MKKLIYLEDALDAIQKERDFLIKRGQTDAEHILTHHAYNVIDELPSAEPYTDEEIQKMQDMEQAQLEKVFELGKAEAQPEIIRCKDCKYSDENWRRVSVRWLPCMDVRTGSNWFCGSAERGEQDE